MISRRPTARSSRVSPIASLNVVHVNDVADGHLLAYGRGVLGERHILGGENMEFSESLRVIAERHGTC